MRDERDERAITIYTESTVLIITKRALLVLMITERALLVLIMRRRRRGRRCGK